MCHEILFGDHTMYRLILVGGGHAQLSVLALLARLRPDVDVTLVTPSPQQIYSGMLPGWMAGHYRLDECHIDLRQLAQAAGVRMIQARVVGMDAARRQLTLSDGTQLAYDGLSLDVGSETHTATLAAAGERLLPVKPLDQFIARWPQIVRAAAAQEGYRLIVVGGGAAGVELAFAAQHAFQTQSCRNATVTLVASAGGILPGHAAGVKARTLRLLRQRGILLVQRQVLGAANGVMLPDGTTLPADCVLAATGAQPFAWLRDSGLALDEAGYVLVDAQHRSVSHPNVFAAGDVAMRNDVNLPRSGVHAVFAGPVVADNLLAGIEGRALQRYRPRRKSLYLLATGPQHAIASWGGFSAQGHWVWRWKNWIDRRFMRKHTRSPELKT